MLKLPQHLLVGCLAVLATYRQAAVKLRGKHSHRPTICSLATENNTRDP